MGCDDIIDVDNAASCSNLAELLPKYVCHKCVKKVMEYNRKGTFGGEISNLTIMFVDIHGFTTLSEKIGPHEAMDVLNTNFDVMIKNIFECDGAVLKFIGDALMVAFGLPHPKEDDVERALYCALKLQHEIRLLQLKQKKHKKIKICIGLHSGDVIMGNIGNPERLDFTIIGDPVNIASRLTDLAQSDEILVGEETLKKTKYIEFKSEYVEQFLLKGKTKKINYYRLYDYMVPPLEHTRRENSQKINCPPNLPFEDLTNH